MSAPPGYAPPATADEFQASLQRHLRYSLAKPQSQLTAHDWFKAVAYTVREWAIDRMIETEARYDAAHAKRLYYLSMEFLIGRSLGNNLYNLGIVDLCRNTLEAMGADLGEIREAEADAALGNGGLGRLAACILDSLATLGMPGYGFGINYEFGLFKQEISDGYQRERPDQWYMEDSPWLIERREDAHFIPLYGQIEHGVDRHGNYNPQWMGWQIIVGVPFEMPVVGFLGRSVNVLRLFAARASDQFDMEIFNSGDYTRAVEQKMRSETVSKVLYPSDAVEAGRELRLIQEYFFVACAVRDIIKKYRERRDTFDQFADKVAIQLNDTHPALAVAELMRQFVDEYDVPWEQAWSITQATCAYTNHTLLPEALERWPVPLFERVLPRHLQIIYEINRRFLDRVIQVWPDDPARLRRMSIIEEDGGKQVRMAHLALVGCHSVNGVSALHSKLVTTALVPDFYALWPERFNNKTNGVTPRRWLLKANPQLADLINRVIGPAWITDLARLRDLEPFATDAGFQQEFRRVKHANKERLARVIKETARVIVDPASMFDVQAKRIHEYKRQLLAAMGIVHTYLRCVDDGVAPRAPRTYIFAGKAAPGYWAAKQIIKLINNLGRVINRDTRTRGMLSVAFVPDYRVSLAEKIIPAADLSEQISTAGKEASGTGNMKFAMNGALTIGTLDGANIEIRDEVGAENIFICGLTADAIDALSRSGTYRPRDYYESNPNVRRVVDALASDRFCAGEPDLFRWIADALLTHDTFFHLADFASYVETQERVDADFIQPTIWAGKAILNVARIGKFSSDRTVEEYAREIWNLKSV